MTDYENAERLRKYLITHTERANKINLCKARPNWNGCDYCDVYAGRGLECWKQDGPHKCVHVQEVSRIENN